MNPLINGKQQRRHRQHGIAAVEFAILLFVLMPIIAGILEIGRAFWYYEAVLKGTRDAARYLSMATATQLKDATAAPATARDIAVQAARAGGVPAEFTSANVSVTCAPTACGAMAQPSDVTQVTVSAQYPIGIGSLLPFIGSAAAAGGGYAVTLAPHTAMPYMW